MFRGSDVSIETSVGYFCFFFSLFFVRIEYLLYVAFRYYRSLLIKKYFDKYLSFGSDAFYFF